MTTRLPSPATMLKGKRVFRVVWKLHTDVLLGYCWCGTAHESEDPIELWEWLLDHAETHGRDTGDEVAPTPLGPPELEYA